MKRDDPRGLRKIDAGELLNLLAILGRLTAALAAMHGHPPDPARVAQVLLAVDDFQAALRHALRD